MLLPSCSSTQRKPPSCMVYHTFHQNTERKRSRKKKVVKREGLEREREQFLLPQVFLTKPCLGGAQPPGDPLPKSSVRTQDVLVNRAGRDLAPSRRAHSSTVIRLSQKENLPPLSSRTEGKWDKVQDLLKGNEFKSKIFYGKRKIE